MGELDAAENPIFKTRKSSIRWSPRRSANHGTSVAALRYTSHLQRRFLAQATNEFRTGVTNAEYLDVPLNPDLVQDQTVICTGWGQGEAYNPTELQDALNEALPNGFDVVALTIEPKSKGSLQEVKMPSKQRSTAQ